MSSNKENWYSIRLYPYRYTRFSRWVEEGIWERVFKILSADADNEYVMIDSTIVRAHQHNNGSGESIGRSAGGLSTKINSAVDALGNPIFFFDRRTEK